MNRFSSNKVIFISSRQLVPGSKFNTKTSCCGIINIREFTATYLEMTDFLKYFSQKLQTLCTTSIIFFFFNNPCEKFLKLLYHRKNN